jgi:hypothetical protein
MSFMDIPETEDVIREAHGVIKPGGFLQFSITHPCFDTPHRRNLRDDDGITYAYEIGDYFRNLHGDIEEWQFSAAGRARGGAAVQDAAVHAHPESVVESIDRGGLLPGLCR